MLIDIDKNLNPYKYEIYLMKPNITREIIRYIPMETLSSFDIVTKYNASNELTLKVPFYLQDVYTHKRIINPIWDLLKERYLLYVKYNTKEEIFCIDDPEIDGETKSYKTIKCFSLEYEELGSKKIKIKDTLKLYDTTGQEKGILNHIKTKTGWKPNLIPSEIIGQLRDFDIDNSSCLDFIFNQIPQLFGSQYITIFNTMQKNYDIIDVNNSGENKGLVISQENWIKNFKRNTDKSKLVTVLYPYGKDDLVINKLQINGQSFIEDYSYFKNTDWMSQDLINSMNAYDNYLQTRNGEFIGYLNTLDGTNDDYIFLAYVDMYKDITTNYQYGAYNEYIVVKSDETHGNTKTWYLFDVVNNFWVCQGVYDASVTGYRIDEKLLGMDYASLNNDYRSKDGEIKSLALSGASASKLYTDLYNSVYGANGIKSKRDIAFVAYNNRKIQIESVKIVWSCTSVASSNQQVYLKVGTDTTITVKVLKTDTQAQIISKLVDAINTHTEAYNGNLYAVIDESDNTKANVYYYTNLLYDDVAVIFNDKYSSGVTFDITKSNTGMVQSMKILCNQCDRLVYWTSQYGETKANTLYDELRQFVYEDIYTNTDVSVESRLKELALIELEKRSRPILNMETDIVSFLDLVKGQKSWNKVVFLDKINVEINDFGIQTELRLIEIQHSFESGIPSLKFIFSNIEKRKVSDEQKIIDLLHKAVNTSNNVSSNLQSLKDSAVKANDLDEQSKLNWDTGKRQILAGDKCKFTLNENGLLMIDEDDDNYQLLMNSTVLGYTRNKWKSVQVAISAKNGVIANELQLVREDNMTKISIDATQGLVIYQNYLRNYYKITSSTSNTAILGGIPLTDTNINPIVRAIINLTLTKNDSLKGFYIETMDAQGNREQHEIIGYNGTTYEVTIAEDWINQPDTNVDYIIWCQSMLIDSQGNLIANQLSTSGHGGSFIQLNESDLSIIDNTDNNYLTKLKLGLIENSGVMSSLLQMGVGSSDLISNIFSLTKDTDGAKFKLTNTNQDLELQMLYNNGIAGESYPKFRFKGEIQTDIPSSVICTESTTDHDTIQFTYSRNGNDVTRDWILYKTDGVYTSRVTPYGDTTNFDLSKMMS